jgi:RNA polymerase sigma factor (sigma-70 family)
MLKNICTDRWKVLRMCEDNCVPLDETIDDNAPPDIEKGETKEFIEYFLAGLTKQQSMIMKMQMQGCTTIEIADITGLSEVNVRVTISRLRKKFREFYYR